MRCFRDMNCSGFLRTPKNNRSLKVQLFASFGLAAFASLFLVVISSCFVVSNSGQKLIHRSQDLMVKQVENRLVSSSELFAMAGRAQFIEDSLQILVESVRDRIAGYPTMEGWETGKYVPFETVDTMEGPDGKRTKQRRYPLDQPPVPLDWQITRDIDVDGINSPFLEPKLKEYPTAISSTKTAHYRIPGIFYNEASAPPINITTELLKNDGIYQSTGDLTVFLKSIWEYIPELLTVEINFFNGGAGTTLQYPATATDDKRFADTYETAGCEWMTLEKNPYTGKPYASEAKCPPPGTVVPSRLRNPMEKRTVKLAVENTSRQFELALKEGKTTRSGIDNTTSFVPPNNFQKSQRDQVLNHLMSWIGPLISKKDNNTAVLAVSKAIYDRITSEFIGVVTFEILETSTGNDLRRRTLDDDSDVYLVYNGNPGRGFILGSTSGSEHKVFETLPEYDEIISAFEKVYEEYLFEWKRVKSSPPNTMPVPKPISSTYFTKTSDDGFLVSVPTPPVPYFPNDNYVPYAFVVQKIPPSIFKEFDVFENRVREDVKKNIILCILLGVVGLILVLSILAVMSNILTQPLTWITIVARKIINNDVQNGSRGRINSNDSNGDAMGNNQNSKVLPSTSIEYFSRGKTESIILEDDVPGMNLDPEAADNDKVGFVNFDYHPEADANAWCTIGTELQQLLEAFQSMIHGFSGDGVSEVAEPGLCEIQNSLTWCSDFSKFYRRSIEEEGSFKKISSKRQASEATAATTVGSVEGSVEGVNSFRILSSNIPVSDLTQISTVGSNNSQVVTDASYHHNPSNEMGDTYCVSPKPNHRDSRHNSRTSLLAAPLESMDELFERASAPQDQPSFLSSAIQDQDSSEECSVSQQLDTPASRFKHDNIIMLPDRPPRTSQMIVPAPIKVNWTSTLNAPKFDPKPIFQKKERPFQKIKIACCSKLFWWIVVLMALPILVTNGVIGAIVSTSILVTLPKTWIENAKQGSNDIELDAMQLFADRKVAIISNMMQGPARDVYLMTRISNWIVFGGIQRSNTSISLDSTSENCKEFLEGECPFSSPCSCDWDVGWNVTGGKCDLDGSIIDSRYLQQQWFEVQKTDSDTVTGNRRSSPSFPNSLNSPESTLWWKNIFNLPGSEVGPSGASGYKTLYDRVAVSSASAVFNFPIYNYPSGAFRERHSFSGYLAFADDGLLVGWSGCDNSHSSGSNFVSTVENGASLIDEDLCANGKYGYDPRCRSWYTKGREKYLQEEIPYHITPLYKDALSDQIAQTITSPIANPKTGEYVGQVALDFKVDFDFIAKMLDEERSISFMITPHVDILGGDTVVSPGSEKGWSSAKIEDLLFTNEPNNVNADYFKQEVLPVMKAGERGDTKFSMTNEDGLEEEICLYYAPVMLPLVVGLRPDEFAAGYKVVEHLIYSLGVGKPCDTIKRPYDGVEDAVNEDMISQEKILISIILSTTILFVIFSVVTAINIAFPMIKLSDIIKNTKKGEYDSIPPLEGGCKEVQGVYNTFAKLNKIVKISNTSFFSGKLEMAHHFVSDALVLYRKINDRKAIGVTCNNLANTLFAIQYEHIDQMKCCDLAKPCHVKQALALYDEAMGYSQQDFDEAEGDLKVNYAIQLADRLFNRGLYFLFIDGYDCAPSDSRERGYNDITYSRNLHDDIRDYMLENKQLFAKASPYFSRLLRRINCLAAFYDDVGLRDVWDAGALLDEANQLLGAATEASLRGNFCPLFEEVNRSGRQQQVDSLEILLALNCADNRLAAMTGMRMLVEDAYLMESAFVRAAEALLRLMKEGDGDFSFSKRSIECTRDDLRAMVKSCKKESLKIGKNALFVLEICPSQWETSNNGNGGGEMLDELELNNQCLWLYDNFLQEDDQIGIFANTMNDTQSVEIGRKEENEGRQRAFLDDATSFSGSRHSSDDESPSGLPRAEACLQKGLEMLIKSFVSLQSDSYVVWVTDGCGRHEDHEIISLRDQIEQLNQERRYQIHILIIALHHNCNDNTCNHSLENQKEHKWRNAQETLLREIGSVSKNSIYLNANSEDELTSAFQWVSRIVSNNRMTSEFISFLTMEKF